MGYHYESKELTDMLLMYGQCYQNIESRGYAERFSESYHPGPRQFINLAQRRNGLKILENYKNMQSIISVNTNILLRRFRLKFLRITYSTSCYTSNASTSKTPCI
jgi:acyl carrier protein phosphodiesterase